MGYVYVIHFDEPYKHAKHYTGYAENDVDERIIKHDAGKGANLMRVVTEAGIGFKIAKVYYNVDRKFERRLKNRGGASKHCPICIAQAKLIKEKKS